MESERVKRVLRSYERVARGEVEAILDETSENVEWRNPSYAVEPGVRRGREEFGKALQGLISAFEETEMVPEEIVEHGDRVVIRLRVRAKGVISGAPIDAAFGHLMTFEGDELAALEWYTSPQEALSVAGLDAWPSGWTPPRAFGPRT